MQAAPRQPGQPPPVKIYNAVYSSVQVYECMVRGIAVMRRRADSYVNATQILKVAGVDKGRRTKILEKEILPGKHEIVQGGYGKYQGTWIPLDRGRHIAMQYGVAPLLAPLFDFTPSANSFQAMPAVPPGQVGNYAPALPGTLAPPPIMPGSALRLLNQGRAQGLFTPSTSTTGLNLTSRQSPYAPTPPPILPSNVQQQLSLKRNRSDTDIDPNLVASNIPANPYPSIKPTTSEQNGNDQPAPTKRLRTDGVPDSDRLRTSLSASELPASNGASRPQSPRLTALPSTSVPKVPDDVPLEEHAPRMSIRPLLPRNHDPTMPVKDPRKIAIFQAICEKDDGNAVIDLIREYNAADVAERGQPAAIDDTTLAVDIVIDSQGHTPLHIAASLARTSIVTALLSKGADVNIGNLNGETPLIRACLSTHASFSASPSATPNAFPLLLSMLHPSIRTLDTAKRSVLHHLASLAGVKNRASAAQYYMDQILWWIAEHQQGDFQGLVNLQDENGDTALNVAARVGNRGLVRTLLDIGADKTKPNRVGLRPGDYGVEIEDLSTGQRQEDLLASLRTGVPAPVQKSQDVIADLTSMVSSLSTDFQAEFKVKQDALDKSSAHLRAATRELAEQRRQIQLWQTKCGELDQTKHRIRNLQRALLDEQSHDWRGRTDAEEVSGIEPQYKKAFQSRASEPGLMDVVVDAKEWPIPADDGDYSVANMVKLRRMKLWMQRSEAVLEERLKSLQGASALKEWQCRKIVALCTGTPIDKVDEMLDNLVIAVESEPQGVDISRVSGFMQKIKDGGPM